MSIGKKAFSPYNPKCMKLITEAGKTSFPFTMTHKSGIVPSLIERLFDDLIHDQGFTALAKLIKISFTRKNVLF